jgi:K+ transporter
MYLAHSPSGIGFAVLGAFLALTGAEAMYADLGHFGALPTCRRPISACRRLGSWNSVSMSRSEA